MKHYIETFELGIVGEQWLAWLLELLGFRLWVFCWWTRAQLWSCFLSFRAHFGWHISLCIFKAKASRGTKLCNYFNFYSLYNIWKDQLYRVSGSEVYKLLFGPKKLAEISKRAPVLSWSSIGERINHYSLDKYHQNVWYYPVNNEFSFGYCTTKTNGIIQWAGIFPMDIAPPKPMELSSEQCFFLWILLSTLWTTGARTSVEYSPANSCHSVSVA